MTNTTLTPFSLSYAAAVKACALASWVHTYSGIFSYEQIRQYVDRFYSDESNSRALELKGRHLLRYVVALDERGEVVGFHAASIDMLCAELTRLYVLPQQMGRGIGSKLLTDAENFFLASGFRSYELKVHRENIQAQKFYERKGFEFVVEDKDNHFILRKSLR